MSTERVYLDHHAGSPLDPRVEQAMNEAAKDVWANPSSPHAEGRRARARMEDARARVAAAIGARSSEIVWTSGGTEACNLAVLGLSHERRGELVTTSIEHPAIGQAVAELEAKGRKVRRIGAAEGVLDLDAMLEAIEATTSLVVMQLVNHETGALLPVREVGQRCRKLGVPFAVDAVQAWGKVPIDVTELGANAIALAAHKLGGPPGIGVLYAERQCSLAPRMLGGAQERGRRAGTIDVRACVGFGAAVGLLEERLERMPQVEALRTRIESLLVSHGARVNAQGARVATCSNVSVAGWRGPSLVAALDLEGIAVASGPACSSGLDVPSAVVGAMYPEDPERARSSIRISLAASTNAQEVDRALEGFARVLSRRPA